MELKSYVPMWFRYRLMDIRGRGVYSDFADEFRCIFIHIPKTAGTSVSQTLFDRASRHIPYFEYEKANRRKFRQYFKFAFVRNPWDRLISTYFFLTKGGLNEVDRRWGEQNLRDYANFDAFVRGWVSEENVQTWVHFLPQHHFICDESLRLKVDYVGRMETIAADFAYVATRLSCQRGLATANRGNHRHYSEYYSPETRDIVGRVYGDDIRLFGYDFHGSDN